MNNFVMIDGKRVEFAARCGNPGIRDNVCPTGYGDCSTCEFCEVKLKGIDILPILWSLSQSTLTSVEK